MIFFSLFLKFLKRALYIINQSQKQQHQKKEEINNQIKNKYKNKYSLKKNGN